MTYMLRKISRSKWEVNLGKDYPEHSADAITCCTRTTNNTLSIWQSNVNDFDDSSVKDVIVALATTMQKPDTIDLLWLDTQWMSDNGLNITAEPAQTKFIAVNERHRDISDLTHEKLGVVSKHIVEQLAVDTNHKRIMKNQLIRLVVECIQRGNTFNSDELSEHWQKAISKIS